MDLNLKGKKALVFGSSTGIGRAIAESLIGEGANVVLCARTRDTLEATAREIGAHSFFETDLTRPGSAKETVMKSMEKLGGLDILVTNTGGPKRGAFHEISTEQWHLDFQSLWMSFVEAVHVALPEMKRQNYGRILLVTSFTAREPRDNLTTSNGFRAGLAGLAKSIANEYAPFGVTVNSLLPGFTDTDRLRELKLSDERIKQMVPMGRLGNPRELADLAAFLASPRAAYITGQSIAVDGGVTRSI